MAIEITNVLDTAGAIPTAKFGGVNDHTEFEEDGTLVARGSATLWDDLTGSLIARRLESTSGRLQYDYSENAIIMQDNGTLGNTADSLIFNFQKPHGAKVDSEMRLHIHWEQTSNEAIVFDGRYRIQNNNAAKTTTWTTFQATMANNVFPYVSGTLNQITSLVAVDMSTSSISCTIEFQLARTDDVGNDDILAIFVDAHIERDNNGSREEYVK